MVCPPVVLAFPAQSPGPNGEHEIAARMAPVLAGVLFAASRAAGIGDVAARRRSGVDGWRRWLSRPPRFDAGAAWMPLGGVEAECLTL